ncbi:fungal-specific transcription factor domain-containing protein [Lipomyces kononenkoae]|uniref:Fungal-specific transcription factor domain-containing protein n=1 Tax=Lipomyces kononenkoae TaxID=34357 RepID=A0ACC3T800_LIPKO
MMMPHINSMIDTSSLPYQQSQGQLNDRQPSYVGPPPPPLQGHEQSSTERHVHEIPVQQGRPSVQTQHEPDSQNKTSPTGSARKRKRSKYVSMACFECKRRKVKCNGENKCERCTKMNLECVYRDPAEYMHRRSVYKGVQHTTEDNLPIIPTSSSTYPSLGSTGSTVLNDRVAAVVANGSSPQYTPVSEVVHKNLKATPSTVTPQLPPMAQFIQPPCPPKHGLDPPLSSVSTPSDRSSRSTSAGFGCLSTLSPAASDTNSSSRRLPKPARAWDNDGAKSFSGPTSSSFPFQHVTGLLNSDAASKAQYKESDEDEEGEPSEESEEDKDDSVNANRKLSISGKDNEKFLYLDYLDAKKLIQVYESEINCMYPIFEVHELDTKYEDFRQYYEEHGNNFPHLQDLSVIKIILAIATGVTETHVAEGRRLYDEVLKMTERNIVAGAADIYTLISLWLIHNYQFHTDLESLAYRTICFAAVLAIELGLHQSSKMSQMFPDPIQRERCRALFWCVYVVDRRMAFSTGRPYTLRDEDIDQTSPQMHTSDEAILDDKRIRALYLNAMIRYSQVFGRVWKVVNAFNPPRHFTINTDEIDYIEFLIHRWQQSLPPELRLYSATERGEHPSPPQLSRKLQTILYLRHNLMFLHLYRPIMFSTRTIAQHMSYALRAVEIALDSIRELSRLHFETDLYASCQIHYNYFLVSALGVLFTAIIHAPTVFAAPCKKEFNMALDLIKLFSKVSRVGRRLWATVKKLRSVTAAYGIGPTEPDGNPRRRNDLPAGDRPLSDAMVTPPLSTGQAIECAVDDSPRPQHEGPTTITPPSQKQTPLASFTGVTGNHQFGFQSQQQQRPLQGQNEHYGQGFGPPPGMSASTSSIDGHNLSTEISEIFTFMTGDSQAGSLSGYDLPTVLVTESVGARLPPFYDPHAPPPGAPVMKLVDMTGRYAPLGMEAAHVAHMLAHGARGDSTWDDELFRLIDNLF